MDRGEKRFLNIIDYIFPLIKNHVVANQVYNTKILKTTPQDMTKLPLIVVEEIDDFLVDRTLSYTQEKFKKVIEVNIYATDIPQANSTVAKQQVADRLKILVDDVLGTQCHMTRISCSETPNADYNIFRYTMRYRCLVDKDYNIYGGRV